MLNVAFKRPISLSERQHKFVNRIAGSLPQPKRATFLADIARHLSRDVEPTDCALICSIHLALDAAVEQAEP